MTAVAATDPSGVEYFFDCVTAGGHDSAWQVSPVYQDTGLNEATSYTYAVKARDKSSNHNETVFSPQRSATTFDITPPIRLVSNLSRTDYTTGVLQVGALVYTDRAYTFTSPIPQDLHNQIYILARDDDRDLTDTDFLRFDLSKASPVFVALDDRIAPPPSWMSGWVKTPWCLRATDSNPRRIVYGKFFPAGEVALGPNRESGMPQGPSMYTVVVAPDAPIIACLPRTASKVLIVAGGGTFSNPTAPQIKEVADRAHQVARLRGFALGDIRYYSSIETHAMNFWVNDAATTASIADSIANWALDAYRLSVILVGPGTIDRQMPEWHFVVDKTAVSEALLSATLLKDLFDYAQYTATPLPEIHLFMEASYSGGFLQKCSDPPAGTRRLIVSSTTHERVSEMRGALGESSFLYRFLDEAYSHKTIFNCHSTARGVTLSYNSPSDAPQIPWLDDDSDGIASSSDGDLARIRYFGVYESGEIGVSGGPLNFGGQDIDLSPTTSMTLTVENSGPGVLSFLGHGIEIQGPDASQFRFADAPTTTALASGGSRQFHIVFDPATIGGKTAALILTTTDADESFFYIPLTGNGLTSQIERTKDKLILVAGGGRFTGNPITRQTKALADMAYEIARLYCGYAPESIRYLSAFETPETDRRVSAVASSAALDDAITSWALDASRLNVLLLDHGSRNPSLPDWFFLINGTMDPPNFISATEVDRILDGAQSGATPLPRAFLFVDACYAGGFLKRCSGVPSGAPPDVKRLVITSTTDSRLACFGGSTGRQSFSFYFLAEAMLGNTLLGSFDSAREIIAMWDLPRNAPQLPWLDDDGDATASVNDGQLTADWVLGNPLSLGDLAPVIVAARPDQQLDKPEDYVLWSEFSPATLPSQVEAYVFYSGNVYPDGYPITNQRVVPLLQQPATSRWSGVLPAGELSRDGLYTIVYTALTTGGLGLDLAAKPVARSLYVGAHPTACDPHWFLYE